MQKTLFLSALLAASTAFGDAIPISSTYGASASAEAVGAAPDSQATGSLNGFPTFPFGAGATSEYIDPLIDLGRLTMTGGAGGTFGLNAFGFTSSLSANAKADRRNIDVNGTSGGGASYSVQFQLTTPHHFDYSAVFSAPYEPSEDGVTLATALGGLSGVDFWADTKSFTRQFSGVLAPGNYSISWSVTASANASAAGQRRVESYVNATHGVSLILTPVPDHGASLAWGLAPLALIAFKRR